MIKPVYVLCVDNGGYPESLEVRKVYALLPDERAAENDYIRVIDETGEDEFIRRSISFPSNCPPNSQDSACRKCST